MHGTDGDLSVIIPTLNEASCIGVTLRQLQSAAVREVIVADGGSTDGTQDVARAVGAAVVPCRRGRAWQMNEGAAAAAGRRLLFLHADTRLPQDFPSHVAEVLNRPGVAAGAFRLRIDAPSPMLRLIERLAVWRSVYFQLPYGDQCIFLTRDVFEAAGRFPPAPVMEDFILMRRLRRLGRIDIAQATATTSARRWLAHGVWRTTMLHQLCIAGYYLGVPIERIAAWRNDT